MNKHVVDTLMRQIEEAVGPEAHRALCEALGGTQVYIPQKVGRHHPLAAAIGLEAAQKLSEAFAGETVVLPITARKRAIVVEGLQAGESVFRIAARAVCSPRYVWKVKAELKDEPETQQGSLF